MRPGADQPPSARLPAHGARARGPGSLGSRHLFHGAAAAAAAAAVAAVAAVTGTGVRANEHAHRGHARGERTWRGSRGSTGAQAGSRGHPDTRPLQGPRVAPGYARGPGRLGPAAQPPGAAAVHSPWHRRARPRPPWRPCILHRTGACCRCANRHSADSQTKRQPAGPFTISQRRVFVTCRWAPSRTHPRMSTHPHVPAPTGRAGCKPALLLGPLHSQTHAEGHNRSALPSHVEGPQQTRALRGEGRVWGVASPSPQEGLPRGGAERARPWVWRRAPPPLPAPPSFPGSPPCLVRSAPEPTGLRLRPNWCARRGSQQADGGTQFQAVRQWSWLCRQPLRPASAPTGPFPWKSGPGQARLRRIT